MAPSVHYRYNGRVRSYNKATKMHLIDYDDGDQKEHDLSPEGGERLDRTEETLRWQMTVAPKNDNHPNMALSASTGWTSS